MYLNLARCYVVIQDNLKGTNESNTWYEQLSKLGASSSLMRGRTLYSLVAVSWSCGSVEMEVLKLLTSTLATSSNAARVVESRGNSSELGLRYESYLSLLFNEHTAWAKGGYSVVRFWSCSHLQSSSHSTCLPCTLATKMTSTGTKAWALPPCKPYLYTTASSMLAQPGVGLTCCAGGWGLGRGGAPGGCGCGTEALGGDGDGDSGDGGDA